jgi:hypothetical protein
LFLFMAATIDMHRNESRNGMAGTFGGGGRTSPGDGDDHYPYEDLTCDLSAEPIAAAITQHRTAHPDDGTHLVDPSPTVESPPLRPMDLTARTARAFGAATPAPLPELSPQLRAGLAAKASAAAVRRAPANPGPAAAALAGRAPNRPPLDRPAAVKAQPSGPQTAAERAALLENTTILEPPPLPKAPPLPPVREARPLPQAAPTTSPAQPAAADVTRPRLLPEQLLLVDPPTEAVGSDPSGQWLQGRYELQMLLGRGGMASVYKAIDHDRVRLGLTDNVVAVKVVQANASRPASSAALLQEFQSAQRLSHPNVINVFDIDRDGDNTFYSMELLSGARLSQLLRRVDGSVLRRSYALAIIRDIGAAIGHAHARGVVHADLKPSNVMITQNGEVRVLDFGGSSMPPREPWVSAGDSDDAYHHATPAYASCEQLERKRADPRDDIYALACIAYLLLAGRHPFDYLSSIEARSRGMQARRPNGMPLGQWRAIRHGLSWDRASQPSDLQAWFARLRLHGAVDRLPPLADLTAPREPGAGWMRPIAIGAIAIAIGVGTGIVLSQSDANWSRQLNAALGSVQGAAQSAWQSLLNFDQKTAAPPSHEHAANAPEPAHPIAAGPPVARASSAPAPAVTAAPAPAVTAAPAHAATAAHAPAATAAAAAPVATAAQATAASTPAEPTVAFAAQSYTVSATDPAARIVVQRNGGATGDLNFVWWTEGDTAQPDVDYASLGAHSERLPSGQERMTVYVPIISNPLRHQTTQFRVVLADVASHRGSGSAPKARATVTIEGNR